MPNSLLKHPVYLRYVFAQVFFHLAYQMLTVAVGWQIYNLTNSALSLGLVGLAQFVPQFLLTLVAGHVADRANRQRIASFCMFIQGLTAAVLAAGSLGGWISSEIIYVCAFVMGAVRTFQAPAVQAMLPSLVERSVFPLAVTYSSAVRNFSTVVGPALGGGIYLLGAEATYGSCVALYMLAGVLIVSIRMSATVPSREPATLKFVFGGITYIRNKPELLGAMSMDLFAVLLGGVTVLLPIYARDILHTGPLGLGLLNAAPAAGALLMTVFLARVPLDRRVGHWMYAGVAVFGLATIVFALSESLILSLIALAIVGAGDMISVVIRSTLVQLETPDSMRGRVSAVNSIFLRSSSTLGQFQTGAVAALIGAVPAAAVGGFGTLVVVALWVKLFPALFSRDKLVTPVEDSVMRAK